METNLIAATKAVLVASTYVCSVYSHHGLIASVFDHAAAFNSFANAVHADARDPNARMHACPASHSTVHAVARRPGTSTPSLFSGYDAVQR